MSETDDCKRPWDHAATYYSTSDQDERLSHEDIDECIEAHLEDRPGTIEEAVSAGVTVYAWRRDEIDVEAEATSQLEDLVENLSEAILDAYGDPEGSSRDVFGDEPEEAFKAAVRPALVALLATVEPWRCHVAGERTFTADELRAWVVEHNPQWLEGKS